MNHWMELIKRNNSTEFGEREVGSKKHVSECLTVMFCPHDNDNDNNTMRLFLFQLQQQRQKKTKDKTRK